MADLGLARPLPRPLRVTIVGSSTATFVTPRRSADEGNYGEQLEKLLHAAGRPVRVSNEAAWLRRVDELFAEAEQRVTRHDPHVVVIDVGWVECQPLVLPLPVLRWTFSWKHRLHPAEVLVRRALRPMLKRIHVAWGPAVVRRGWPVPSRLSEPRFVAELERFIDLVAERHRALVLLVNVPPTLAHLDDVLPGIQQRAARYSAAIDGVVARAASPDVRLVDVRAMVAAGPTEDLLPDGIHFNAAGHDLVARRLAAEIDDWIGRCGRSCRNRER